jgi:hypothetical protein
MALRNLLKPSVAALTTSVGGVSAHSAGTMSKDSDRNAASMLFQPILLGFALLNIFSSS